MYRPALSRFCPAAALLPSPPTRQSPAAPPLQRLSLPAGWAAACRFGRHQGAREPPVDTAVGNPGGQLLTGRAAGTRKPEPAAGGAGRREPRRRPWMQVRARGPVRAARPPPGLQGPRSGLRGGGAGKPGRDRPSSGGSFCGAPARACPGTPAPHTGGTRSVAASATPPPAASSVGAPAGELRGGPSAWAGSPRGPISPPGAGSGPSSGNLGGVFHSPPPRPVLLAMALFAPLGATLARGRAPTDLEATRGGWGGGAEPERWGGEAGPRKGSLREPRRPPSPSAPGPKAGAGQGTARPSNPRFWPRESQAG